MQTARVGKTVIDTRPDTAIRLEQARLRRGFKSAKAAARRFNWNYDGYIQHERGERGYGKKAAEYADAYRVSLAWLLTGEGPESATVPVVGYVGAGGDVVYSEELDGEDTIGRPSAAPENAVAVQIRGDSLGHGFDRWYAVYDRRQAPVTENLIGVLCVVGTEDGRSLIKWVRKGSRKGRYHLVSGTGAIEEDVPLAWGAEVIDLKPR